MASMAGGAASHSTLQNLPPFAESNNPTVLGVLSSFLLVAIIAYCLRVYSRIRVYRVFGLDDYAISIAMVLSIVNWAMVTNSLLATGGRHIMYIEPSALQQYAKVGFFTMPLWVWAMTWIKVSVSLLCLRIEQSKQWRYGVWSLIVLLFTMAIVSTVCQLLQCRPISGNWDIFSTSKVCWAPEKVRAATYSVSAIFIMTDVICALLPLHFIRQLSRPLHERVVLFTLMALGLVATVCGIVKVAILKKSMESNDPVFDGAKIVIWSFLEEYLGIIAACIPCLKALLQKAFKALGGHISSITRTYNTRHELTSDPSHRYANNSHALRSSQTNTTFFNKTQGVWPAPTTSEEGLVTTVSGKQVKYDIESPHITKEVVVSWCENPR